MRHTTQKVMAILSGAIGAAVVLTSCTQFARAGFEADRSSETETQSSFSLAALARRGNAIATKTTSVALDRIDQRQLPLDATYRRSGSGRGVTVYVFDGGVSPTHPELAGRVRTGYTAFPSDPKICNAHGTAVAGAIAGTTLGVAPEAEIVDVKMVQCSTLRGTIKGIVDGAKWTIEDHKVRGGAAVANWSFIADTAADIPALDSAVAALRAAGIPGIADRALVGGGVDGGGPVGLERDGRPALVDAPLAAGRQHLVGAGRLGLLHGRAKRRCRLHGVAPHRASSGPLSASSDFG